MKIIDIKQKLTLIDAFWDPKIIGEVNESHVKIAKIKGTFVMHKHDQEDEMFYVIHGHLLIHTETEDFYLEEGQMIVIPQGVFHQPIAEEEVHIMMIEPKTTINTGNVKNEFTKTDVEQI